MASPLKGRQGAGKGGFFSNATVSGMDGSFWTGAALVAIGAALVFVGMPNRDGQSPRFLRFGAAISIYPGIIMIFLAMGAAELFMAAG